MPSKKQRITVYLGPEEYSRIQESANRAGLSLSTFCKRVCIGTPVPGLEHRQAVKDILKANADLGRLGGLFKLALSSTLGGHDRLIPLVYSDTLTSLVTADPTGPDTPRWMTDEVYDHAFDAWQIARKSAWDAWEKLTDPFNLQPDVPRSFRDATDLVLRAGGFLGTEDQTDLRLRLGAVPTAKIARAVRTAINDGNTDEQRINLIKEVLDSAGIQIPPPPEPLPYVNTGEVHLVGWTCTRHSSRRSLGGKKPGPVSWTMFSCRRRATATWVNPTGRGYILWTHYAARQG